MFSRLFIIPLFFALPQLVMNWGGSSKTDLTVRIAQHHPLVEECQKSGSEVYYRYEYKLCRRRVGWFDKCADSTVETRILKFDPISENYTLTSDKLGDDAQSVSTNYTSLEEAMEDLSFIKGIKIDPSSVGVSNMDLLYIRARAKFICRGQTNATLDRLSSIVTLGLASVGTADSGWIDFYLSH